MGLVPALTAFVLCGRSLCTWPPPRYADTPRDTRTQVDTESLSGVTVKLRDAEGVIGSLRTDDGAGRGDGVKHR